MSITLRNQATDGEPLEATFLPESGMNMQSYMKAGIEVIDPATKNLFEERFAGYGPLIGPHFHRRNPSVLRPIKDETLFPHIARVRAKGVQDPFSHGIARYAPWTILKSNESSIRASLTGKDLWNGIPLADLEGQNFKMLYGIDLTPAGLQLELSVVSDTDSLVGIHFYYKLVDNKGFVTSSVAPEYLDDGHRKPIPADWPYNASQHLLHWDLSHPCDYTMHPYPNPLSGTISLETGGYRLITHYESPSEENCWQFWHPEGASFVCIEPISAQDPHHPNLTVSSVTIQLTIESL